MRNVERRLRETVLERETEQLRLLSGQQELRAKIEKQGRRLTELERQKAYYRQFEVNVLNLLILGVLVM